MSRSLRLLIISRVIHVPCGDSLLIQHKRYWLWKQISLWSVSSASKSLIVARGRHGHFEWLAFDTHQWFFDFKINNLFDFFVKCFKVACYFQYYILFFRRKTNKLLYRHLAITLFFISINALSILRQNITSKMSTFQAYNQAEKILWTCFRLG